MVHMIVFIVTSNQGTKNLSKALSFVLVWKIVEQEASTNTENLIIGEKMIHSFIHSTWEDIFSKIERATYAHKVSFNCRELNWWMDIIYQSSHPYNKNCSHPWVTTIYWWIDNLSFFLQCLHSMYIREHMW